MTGHQRKHLESNSRLLIKKQTDTNGNYILKFVELQIKDSLGAVMTPCTFKLSKKPDHQTDTFVFCKEIDAVIAYMGTSLAIYTKPDHKDDCWDKGEVEKEEGSIANMLKTS